MKEDMSDTYESVMKEIKNDQEQFWNSLSKEDQLKVFCAVSRRIFEGELKDKGSYRHILYQVFGFGAEAYIQALEAGYLAIHNSIVDETYDRKLLEAFCKKYSIEDSEQKILNFLPEGLHEVDQEHLNDQKIVLENLYYLYFKDSEKFKTSAFEFIRDYLGKAV